MDDRIEVTEAWAELVDDLRRGRVYSVDGKRGLGFTAEQVSRLNMPVYDVRGLSLETVSVEEIDAATMMPMRERVLFAEGQTRDGVKRPLVAVIPNIQADAYAIFVRMDFGWVNRLEGEGGWTDFITTVANILIDDAEANIEVRDAPTPRFDSVNRGRELAKFPALEKVRVISLSTPRIAYEQRGRTGSGSHGGTHASPVEHARTITDRWIYPKNRKAYQRKAKTIIVNEGVTRVTVVKQ